MAYYDEKARPKREGPCLTKEEIPIPVAALPARAPRSTRAGRVVKHTLRFALLIWAVLAVSRWSRTMLEQELDVHEGRWIGRAFSQGMGWSKRKAPYGKKAEKLFLAVPNAKSATEASHQYATKPHMAGTPGDLDTAKDFLRLLQTQLHARAPHSHPHHRHADADVHPLPIFDAGSPESRAATLGISKLSRPVAWVDKYFPVMNTPLEHSVEVLDDSGNVVWKAELEEVADDTDPEAGKYFDAITTWHGLSRGGTAQGKLVYANYGTKEDYDELVEKGVDMNGAIVITRYGGIFRGLKVKGAQEHGAAACLIYSDPRDDGTVTVDNGYAPYPWGPARNPNSVQRGSTQFLSIYPGDPTTPGYPSYENSTRTEGTNIPSIPSLPISWHNAQILLEEIKPYGMNRTIKVVNNVDDKVIPIWNVMGVIPGHIKDEVVVIGNHRDAWVMGAADPSSGTSSIHETIRGLGHLLRHGWKPLRTILIASWDAEEYGLIGSTEWGEDFADWIDEHVVAYLNLDGSASGSRFRASATPSLAHFVRAAAEEIEHPTKPGKTLWDATKDSGVLLGNRTDAEALAMYDAQEAALAATSTGVGVLGSGSDFTVFVQRNGIASTNGGFGSTLQDPVYHYHSVFDTQRWMEIYGDPGFGRHVAVAKHLGLQTLRLADSIVLPINTTHHALELEKYLNKVEAIASTTSLDVDFTGLRSAIHDLQTASAALDDEKAAAEHAIRKLLHRFAHRHFWRRTFRSAFCRVRTFFTGNDDCPLRDHEKNRPLDSAMLGREDKAFECASMNGGGGNKAGLLPFRPSARIGRAPAWAREQARAREWEQEIGGEAEVLETFDKGRKFPWRKFREAARRVRQANAKLVAFERGFIHEEGIKDREWYRNLDVAPGKWLGYGATTFPALTEAFTIEKNTTLAEYEAKRLQTLIENMRDAIKV